MYTHTSHFNIRNMFPKQQHFFKKHCKFPGTDQENFPGDGPAHCVLSVTKDSRDEMYYETDPGFP